MSGEPELQTAQGEVSPMTEGGACSETMRMGVMPRGSSRPPPAASPCNVFRIDLDQNRSLSTNTSPPPPPP
ncbi:hypothetical protein DPEC_G00309830 [Dallia pectoralis]|uniref:Uncharacterized protein n=1 Tax=Dallia pectoralis TaxID=75939 RepID=A0ACC2FF45_DALPE|nr:hypothetical protein DPEC_G00309830 [Dallia pectoralis]